MRRRRLQALVGWSPAGDEAPATWAGARIARAGLVLGAAAAVVQGVVHLLNLLLFDLRVYALNADVDVGAFMWASTGVTFAAGVVLLALGRLASSTRWLAWGAAAAILLLSLDDLLGLHERLSGLKTTIGPLDHASRLFWPLATMPLLAAVFLGTWALANASSGTPRRAVRLGLLALVLAVVLEMLSPLLFLVGQDHGLLGYELEVVVEEGLELFGWSAVLSGLLGLLLSTAVRAEHADPGRHRPGVPS